MAASRTVMSWVVHFVWPGAIHEGDGTRRFILDEKTTPDQRKALMELYSGSHGGTYFEIFASVCPNTLEPIIAPLEVQLNREKRVATLRIPGIAESKIEPIRNAVPLPVPRLPARLF